MGSRLRGTALTARVGCEVSTLRCALALHWLRSSIDNCLGDPTAGEGHWLIALTITRSPSTDRPASFKKRPSVRTPVEVLSSAEGPAGPRGPGPPDPDQGQTAYATWFSVVSEARKIASSMRRSVTAASKPGLAG